MSKSFFIPVVTNGAKDQVFIPDATSTACGLLTDAQAVKLAGIPSGGYAGGDVAAPVYVDDGNHAAAGLGEPGSSTTASLLVEELTIAAGQTVSIQDVVVWGGTAAGEFGAIQTSGAAGEFGAIQTSGATANLTTIAGVALEGGTGGQKIKVCRRGRCNVNLSGGAVTKGMLVGTVADAGSAGDSTPGAGAILGRSTQAASSGSFIVDVTL